MPYTWFTITEAMTDPGAPGTAELWKAWWKNPLAMFEGATGAPRLQGLGVARPGDGLPVATVSAADTVEASRGAGGAGGTVVTTSSSLITAYTYTIVSYTGSLRFKAAHRQTGGTSSTLEIWKNGSMVDSWSTASTSDVARSKDISIVPGDVIAWRHSAGGGATSYFTLTGVFANDGYVAVTPLALSSAL